MAETARELVDSWDRNNGIALLADHREDLVTRLEQFEAQVRREALEEAANLTLSLNLEAYGKWRIDRNLLAAMIRERAERCICASGLKPEPGCAVHGLGAK
jgi:hypothetical protein